MTALSVIIPFYDERAFLRGALNSVFSQRVEAMQVIVVNDNPDMFSPADMTELAGDRVELVQHRRNLGLSAARNSGLARARGRFVAFLDADDFYVGSGLARQFARADETGADITHAQTYYSRPGNPATRLLPRDEALFSEPVCTHGLLDAERAQFIVSSWSSIYRRDFLARNDLRFDAEQTRFEDRLFVLQTVTRAEKIAFLGHPTRVWRGRAGSISVAPPSPETDLLKVQLLEKCLAHIRAEVAANRLPPRILKRELFNTVSRLIWDMQVIDAICRDSDRAGLGARIVALLGQDRFGQAILDDEVLRAWFTLHPQSGTGTDASLLAPADRLALLAQWQAQSADFAAARGYAPALEPALAALAARDWRPPTGIALDWLRDLVDIAGQTGAALPETPRSAAPHDRPHAAEMTLTVRLRPWAARLARRLSIRQSGAISPAARRAWKSR